MTCSKMVDLLHTLEREPESAVDWFKHNHMIEKPDNFQANISNKTGKEKKIRNYVQKQPYN